MIYDTASLLCIRKPQLKKFGLSKLSARVYEVKFFT